MSCMYLYTIKSGILCPFSSINKCILYMFDVIIRHCVYVKLII